MLVMDSLRGKDSCGVATITNGRIATFKRAMPACDFIQMKPYDNLFNPTQTEMVMMHNRAATKGAVDTDNAHPFTVGDITLMHNGTLRGQWRLPDNTSYLNDSHNIAHAVNKEGIEETWGKLDGPAVLIWWDEKDKSLNVIRNAERPLWYTVNKDGQVYAASEYYMLAAGLDRNSIDLGEIKEVPVNQRFKFKVEDNKVKTYVKKLEALEVSYYDYWGGGNYQASSKSLINFEVGGKDVMGGRAAGVTYSVDGDDGQFYTIDDYTDKLKLKVGDRRSGPLLYIQKGERFISAYDIRIEQPIEGEVVEDDDIPFDNPVTQGEWENYYDSMAVDEESNRDVLLDSCDMCQEAFKPGEAATVTSDGSAFCSYCVESSTVAPYLTGNYQEVIA